MGQTFALSVWWVGGGWCGCRLGLGWAVGCLSQYRSSSSSSSNGSAAKRNASRVRGKGKGREGNGNAGEWNTGALTEPRRRERVSSKVNGSTIKTIASERDAKPKTWTG